jgi:hypothetical protein
VRWGVSISWLDSNAGAYQEEYREQLKDVPRRKLCSPKKEVFMNRYLLVENSTIAK